MNVRIRNRVFAFSGILVLAGSALYLSAWMYAPWLFAVGAAGVTLCYMTLPSGGADFQTRRRNRLNTLAGIAMIVASVFMFRHRMEWVAFLLISALVQIYTSSGRSKK